MSDSIWFGTLIKEEVLDIDVKPLIEFVYQKKNELPNSKSGSHVDAWQSPSLQDDPIFLPLLEIGRSKSGKSKLQSDFACLIRINFFMD